MRRFLWVSLLLPFRLAWAGTFAVYGDTRDNDAEHARVVHAIAQAHPQLALFLGDAVVDGSDSALWKRFREIEAPLLKGVPVYAVQGNHDTAEALDRQIPLPATLKRRDGFMSFDALGLHFVALDTERPLEPGAPQFEHLVVDLKAAAGRPAPIVVFMHRAMYSSGHHGSDLGLQRDLGPLFSQAGVRAVFQSHDHDYERSVPQGGVTYFVEGGGGAPLRPFDGPAPAWSAERHLGYGYLLVDADSGTLSVKAFDSGGTLIDQVQLTAPAPQAQPAAVRPPPRAATGSTP